MALQWSTSVGLVQDITKVPVNASCDGQWTSKQCPESSWPLIVMLGFDVYWGNYGDA